MKTYEPRIIAGVTDEQRRADGIQTCQGAKKAEAVTIPEDIDQALKQQPKTGQGRRDELIMCLLLDHGLRVGEVAILTAKAFDMKPRTFTFYRPKVNQIQTHTLTSDTRKATRAYLKHALAEGILWRKSGEGLSPHDCRYYAATFEARKGMPVDRLVDMFGWNRAAMAFRYIEAAQIANDGTARVRAAIKLQAPTFPQQ